jgi:hypothetical protein
LDPKLIADLASRQDQLKALQDRALLDVTDPGLLASRAAGQEQLSRIIGGLGTGPEDAIAQMAASEAAAGGAATQDLKSRLFSAATTELGAGASLPPDVQAELVKAGLERSGMTTGRASSQGVGGNLIRRFIGERALALQADRQNRAMQLATTASNLDAQRQQILQGLFPSLQAKTINQANLAALPTGISQGIMAGQPSGLSGADVAKIWLARVGATSDLRQQEGDAAAKYAASIGANWAPRIESAISSIPTAYSDTKKFGNDARFWS